MIARGRFFLPGPTEVDPDILRAMQQPMIGHRGAEMERLLAALAGPLGGVFRTVRPVLLATCSATGLMEAAIRNGVRHRVLCLVNGAFSERFAAIAAACGREVVRVDVPWGETFEPEIVRRFLRDAGVDAVTLVHSETSTGALAPLAEIAQAVREHEDVLLLVDAVTSLAGSPVETDAWGLDFVLTGSQKALALPPGLALGVASERLLERAASLSDRGAYFDLVTYTEQARKNQTPHTPSIALLYALRAQCERLAREGIEARWERHRAMQQRVERWVTERGAESGLAFLPKEGRRSWTVSCLRVNGRRPGGGVGGGRELARAMGERGFVIGAGYGKLADATIRIGHMGDHTLAELEALLEALSEAVA